ncbi:Polyamine deacetylase HDAC10, partial [Galemys pyrenaicus]
VGPDCKAGWERSDPAHAGGPKVTPLGHGDRSCVPRGHDRPQAALGRCEIECPERLTAVLECLRQRGLEQRCLRLKAREASAEELGLVHSPEYVALLRGTQTLDTGALQALSAQYDAVYFHPSTFHCARLAVGAALQLVDAVLTGAAHNGLALVRPPGHHSQRAAACGFCVFNNVAVAAQYAKQKHGLRRILIVDWDIHHGQGIQYIFEDDPSVLYFSWHRYEHGRFWPYLRDSDADAVGRGPGRGFTVNLPWNQVGMGNADYLAAFLSVLLPLAFEPFLSPRTWPCGQFDPELVLVSAGFDSAVGDPEVRVGLAGEGAGVQPGPVTPGSFQGQMLATPECFAHLTRLLQVLAGGRVCAVLEGGYHLQSLSLSVCMTVQTLLGDLPPPLSGPMVPHRSTQESVRSTQAAQAPHWMSLRQPDAAPALSPGPGSPERGSSPPPPGGLAVSEAATQAAVALSAFLGQLRLCPTPPVRAAAALPAPAALALPPTVLRQEASALWGDLQAWARPHKALTQTEALTVLGKALCLLDGIRDGQVSSGLAALPAPAMAAALDVALRHCLSQGAQRLFCVAVGQLERPPGLANDGCLTAHVSVCSFPPGRRTLCLRIGGKEAAAPSMFHVSTPLPGTTGGFLSCVLALVLPLAYDFQPDLVLVVLGPAHGLQAPCAALLAALLQGPAGGRVLVMVEEESTPQLAGVLAQVLLGEAPPSLGVFSPASPEDMQALVYLRRQLGPRWKMLQVAGEAGAQAEHGVWDCVGPRAVLP